MILFKTRTVEFEFDRYLEHMVSYQGMQSGLPMFLVGEFGTLEIFMQNDCLLSLIFHMSPTTNIKINRSCTEYDHILLFTNHKSTLL